MCDCQRHVPSALWKDSTDASVIKNILNYNQLIDQKYWKQITIVLTEIVDNFRDVV